MTRMLPCAIVVCVAVAGLASRANAQDPGRRVDLTLGDHPSVSFGSALTLDFRARVESDQRMATPDVGLDRSRFAWQSPRVGVEGRLFKKGSFEFSHDLGERAELKDAYVNLRVSRALEVEAGRFKLPFSPDTLRGRHNLDFVHRSLGATELSPGRDTGIMMHGRLFGRTTTYAAGVFARDGDNARTAYIRGGRSAVALRLTVRPFAREADSRLAPLRFGLALATSHLDHRLGLRGQTVFGDGVFFDRASVNGRRVRAGLEASWENGPASVSAEYITAADERRGAGFAGEDLSSVRATAWYVAGTWVATGEKKDGWVEPKRALLRGGPGAVEIVARVEALRFDSVAHPGTVFGFPAAQALLANTDRVKTLGINWYLDRHLRLQANLVIESMRDSQRSPAPTAAGHFMSSVVRIQFVL